MAEPEEVPVLVLSDDELTVLAASVGESAFPGVEGAAPDEGRARAARRTLAERGVVRDDLTDDAFDDATAITAVVLDADAALSMTIRSASEERREIVWVKGAVLVAQSTLEGRHAFRATDRAALGAIVERLIDGPVVHGDRPTWRRVVAGTALAEAGEDLAQMGLAATVLRRPALSAYLAALAGARHVVGVEARRHRPGGRIEGEALTLVEAGPHGLWIVDGDGCENGMVAVGRVGLDAARARITALLRDD